METMREGASVSHDRDEETAKAKARWFSGLPLSERMDLLVAYTNLILENNPGIVERKHARSVRGRVRVLAEA